MKSSLRLGFDLDMTLVDSSAAILKSAQATIEKYTGANAIPELEIRNSIGLPMATSLKKWIHPNFAEEAFEFYKQYYRESALHLSKALPGACELLDELQSRLIPFCVITAKDEKVAEAQLAHLNFPKSIIYGDRFRERKTEAMLEFRCTHYIGDHFEDYKSAKLGQVAFVGLDFNRNHDLRGELPDDSLVLSGFDGLLAHLDSVSFVKVRTTEEE